MAYDPNEPDISQAPKMVNAKGGMQFRFTKLPSSLTNLTNFARELKPLNLPDQPGYHAASLSGGGLSKLPIKLIVSFSDNDPKTKERFIKILSPLLLKYGGKKI